MPFDRSRYPSDWEAIRDRIRNRAGGKCEGCGAVNYQPHPITGSKVVLTIAHLGTPHTDGRAGDKHDKMDCRDENLAALCQRCHLRYDIQEHVQNAARTRLRRRVERGQMELMQK